MKKWFNSDNQDPFFYYNFVSSCVWAAALFGMIWLLSTLPGCTTLNTDPALTAPTGSPTVEYRSDLVLDVNGVKYPGTGVAALSQSYKVTVYPEASIDRIIWTTCNQQHVVDKPGESFWDQISGNNQYSFTLNPDIDLEGSNACALEISVLTEHQNITGYGLIDFMDARPVYQKIKATARCNGYTSVPTGVYVCQSAQNLVQDFVFDRPVISGTPVVGCSIPVDVDGGRIHYRLTLSSGKCLYIFGDKDGNFFRLNAIGYNEVPYRE